MCAKPLQSCLTLCDPMDCSPPGSSLPGILRARILEGLTMCLPSQGDLPDSGNPCLLYLLDWQLGSLPLAPLEKPQHEVYTPFQFISVQLLSHVQLFVTPWTAACQASMSITNSWILLKLMSIEPVMSSKHLILCCPLLLPSLFPSIRVFSPLNTYISKDLRTQILRARG